ELRARGVLVVEVDASRVHRHRREEDVVGLGDRAGERVLHDESDRQLFEPLAVMRRGHDGDGSMVAGIVRRCPWACRRAEPAPSVPRGGERWTVRRSWRGRSRTGRNGEGAGMHRSRWVLCFVALAASAAIVAVGAGTGSAVSESNTFTVKKVVDGVAPPGTEFTVEVDCGEGPIAMHFDAQGNPDPSGSNVVEIGAGHTCTATETATGGAKSVDYQCDL